MVIKTKSERFQKQLLSIRRNDQPLSRLLSLLPYAIFGGMVATLLLLDAVLALGGLKFADALLTHLGSWPILPTRILFQRAPVILFQPGNSHKGAYIPPAISLKEAELLFAAFCIVFLCYLLAVRYLPRRISFHYILLSTLLLGIVCMLIPVVTSTDMFSYIAYARMDVIYHLNPLTTIPKVIHTDPIYSHIYWRGQPSIYGPTWIMIISLLQWLTLALRFRNILSMVLALRVFGLMVHLAATWLIYSISGRLQLPGIVLSPERRMRAVLAFAWNPLLLLEACMNAHNDTTLLFLLLLSLWFLVGRQGRKGRQVTVRASLAAMVVFGLATCLKVNVAIFIPGLLMFLWQQQSRGRRLLALMSVATYVGVIILLYAPFWQGGAVLDALQVNPGTYRNINTYADFLGRFYNSVTHSSGYLAFSSTVSPAQYVAHIVSTALFVILYVLLYWWWAIRTPGNFNTFSGLLRWMALVWLLYCAIGSPWFWPWYAITFFGLYALIEAMSTRDIVALGLIRLPMAARLLAFSIMSLYWFFSVVPAQFFIPGIRGFRWVYLAGLWAWMLPLLALQLQLPLAANLREAALLLLYHLADIFHWEKLRAWLQRA